MRRTPVPIHRLDPRPMTDQARPAAANPVRRTLRQLVDEDRPQEESTQRELSRNVWQPFDVFERLDRLCIWDRGREGT